MPKSSSTNDLKALEVMLYVELFLLVNFFHDISQFGLKGLHGADRSSVHLFPSRTEQLSLLPLMILQSNAGK